MLTAIKQRATGWVAWAIVVLITIPFALWGINSYFEGGTEVSVASVNGQDLPLYVYQESLQNRTRLLHQQLGSAFDPETLDSLQIRTQVVDSLIDRTIMEQYVHENRFQISDEQLNRAIHDVELFQTDGQFDSVQYRSVLAANRYTPEIYEQLERTNQAANQVRLGIAASAFVLDEEIDRLLAIQQQQREIQYVLLEVAEFSEEIEISDEQVQEYYDNNTEDFVSQARIKVDFVELDVESLAGSMVPSDEQITEYYEENKGRFKTAESRRASHILIGTNDSDTDAARDEKRKLAETLRDRILAGEDFAELAQEYSDDPGSKNSGGDLGVVARGQMVKPFEETVYSMMEGDIEGPVETQYGFHIIKLVELTKQQQQTLEEAREVVMDELRDVMAEQRFAELAEPFMNLVFEHPESLELVSEELSLAISESDWFTENEGDGIASESRVRRVAFSEDVLAENLVSQPIEIGFERIIAIQKHEHEPSATQPLDQVRDRIMSILRDERAKQKVLSLGNEYSVMLEEMNATSEQWIAFFEDKGLEIMDQSYSSRGDIFGSQQKLGEAVYATARPDKGLGALGSAILANGDYALYQVLAVTDGNPDEVDDSTRELLSDQLSANEGTGMISGFSKSLRDQADIEIYAERL